jgi:outer membrane protein OmpA-like peptidoglycan-associated protein
MPVRSTAARDPYFAAGGYARDDDRSTAPAGRDTPAPGARMLSSRLPWDEISLEGFAPNGVSLAATHRQALASLARALADAVSRHCDTFLTAVGHADAAETGAEGLAQRRADAVVSELSALGVPAKMMHASGAVERGAGPPESCRKVVVRVVKRDFAAERRAPWSTPQLSPADARHSGGGSVETLVHDEIERLRLPVSLGPRVHALAVVALEKGLAAAYESVAADTHLDDATRESIRTILKGVVKLR